MHSIMPLPQILLPTVKKPETSRKSSAAEKAAKARADVFRIPSSEDEFGEPPASGGTVDILV